MRIGREVRAVTLSQSPPLPVTSSPSCYLHYPLAPVGFGCSAPLQGSAEMRGRRHGPGPWFQRGWQEWRGGWREEGQTCWVACAHEVEGQRSLRRGCGCRGGEGPGAAPRACTREDGSPAWDQPEGTPQETDETGRLPSSHCTGGRSHIHAPLRCSEQPAFITVKVSGCRGGGHCSVGLAPESRPVRNQPGGSRLLPGGRRFHVPRGLSASCFKRVPSVGPVWRFCH